MGLTERKQPVNLLDITQTKKFIREHEENFYVGLRRYSSCNADNDGYSGRAFTGRWLCMEASFVWDRALKRRYGQNLALWIVQGKVITQNYLVNLYSFTPHYRLHFISKEGINGFIDPTYGQVGLLIE